MRGDGRLAGVPRQLETVHHSGRRIDEKLEKNCDRPGVVVVLVAVIIGFHRLQSHKGSSRCRPARPSAGLASVVSASGEIKPKTYVNIGANAFGKIIKLYVREGDRVKRGQLLAQLENVQSAADVAATRASLEPPKPIPSRPKPR